MALVLIISSSIASAQEKKVITKAEDLPQHSYTLENRDVLSFVQNKQEALKMAAMVKSDLLADLQNYDIQENASLRNYYGNLGMINILEGNYKEALGYIEKMRAHADKPSGKIMNGIESEVLIEALMGNNATDADKISAQITASLIEKLNAADFEVIREEVEYQKGMSEVMSKNFMIGFIKSDMQPALDNNKGEVPGKLIMRLLEIHYAYEHYLPYKEAYVNAYRAVLAENAHNVEKVDIWAAREVTIKEDPNYSPVLIGIWDTGVDSPVLPEKKQWKNPLEKFDGKDTDGNGFVDDVYGIAYDRDAFKDANYLEPTAHNMEDKALYQQLAKGYMDLTANIESEEASSVREYMSKIEPEEVASYLDKLYAYLGYIHGTHVAGVAEAGNDMAKIISARRTSDYGAIPQAPTEEGIRREAKAYAEIVAYFKKNKVRVVNMSWGKSYEFMLRAIELNGIGKDDAERKALAKEYFTIQYEAFKNALASAPEILFICAAGNTNDDVDFSADYPSSINLPNLITVGAVDIEGKKASFTTEGKSVDVYANGYEVESYVPGGERMAFSGTSAASPQVANLAGKILVVNPQLTPEEVIELILSTATKSDENVLLIHPKNAVELARGNQNTDTRKSY